MFLTNPAFCSEKTLNLINQYSVKKLTAEDGFVSSEIYSIIQDTQGLLWFGTAENGVMRFDGQKVTLFEFDSMNLNGLSHNDAGNLMLDKNGNIWIGTWGGGANMYDPRKGKFQTFTHEPSKETTISSNRIQSLFHDQQGIIWLGSYDNGLSRHIKGSQFDRIAKVKGQLNSLSHNRIWDIEDNNDSSLWIATSYGLNLYDKYNQSFQHFFPDSNNKSPTGANEIRSILKTTADVIYVGTQQGPYIFEPSIAQFTPLKTNTGQYLGQVNSMIEDHEGLIWFVTSSGVYRYSPELHRVEKLELDHNNGLRIIFEDSANTLWITSEIHGIYKLTAHRKFKSINSASLVVPNGIAVDDKGDLIIASSTSELFKWNVATQNLESLSPAIFSIENGYEGNRLLEKPIIYPQGKDDLWIAQDEGLAHFNLTSKTIEIITYPDTEPNYKEFRELRALNIDDKGVLWIGTYKNGVYQYDTVTKKFRHLDDSYGLSHREVLEIFKDNEQNMWVGTGDGVNLWQASEQHFISFTNNKNDPTSLLGSIVQDVHQTQHGDIWIATQKGLNLYLPETHNFKHFNAESGLATSLIRAIADDDEGDLWLTTNKGVSKLTPSTGTVINYSAENGVLGANYYANSLVRGADKTLFSSSQRGVEFFNTASVDAKHHDANLILTGFNKMGQPVELETPYSYTSDIQLSYLDYFFSFEFAVLDFNSPTKNQYAYKLEGYDDNWIEIGNRNTASFTNLDGGSYVFLVKAKNRNGYWGKKLLSINLHISSPPWKSWWAYCLYVLFVVLVVFTTILIRTRLQQIEIVKQKQFVTALEEQVNDKTASLKVQASDLTEALKKAEEATKLKSEFLANMSHEIRTPMNGVLGMLDLLKNSDLTAEQSHKINIANSSAHSLLSLIDDILDFSKIEADKLDLEMLDFDLRSLLEQLVGSVALSAESKQVEIILDLSGVECSMVNSDPGRIRQILTNLLSNAIKFTEQGEIVISVKLSTAPDSSQYVVSCDITDTGIGIPQEKLSLLFDAFSQVDASTTRKYGGTGLGLSITKKLCNLLHGDITVTSEEGVGSCFHVTFIVQKSNSSRIVEPKTEQRNLLVLVVDNNQSNREVMTRQLTKWGFDVTAVGSGIKALEYCDKQYKENSKIDLMFIDMTMPDMNGEMLANRIRANEKYQDMKLVMMTSLDETSDTSRYSHNGIDSFFPKPVTTENLLDSLALFSDKRKEQTNNIDLKTSNINETHSSDFSNHWPSDARVLLVEDNKINQVVALNVLKNIGLKADVAFDGVEALKTIHDATNSKPYTVIIMDCQMPEMDGYEATRRIRQGDAGESNKQIPIIAMTANAMQGDKEKCLDAGMNDYLTKPIVPDNVFEKLNYWLNEQA